MAHILVLGADGYLGWPMTMYLSSRGYAVTAVDNYYKRHAAEYCKVSPLNPLPPLDERASAWQACSGNRVSVVIADLTEVDVLQSLVQTHNYTAVIHFAEQPSAPYSMIDSHTAQETLLNNIGVTGNLIQALRRYSPATHVIKLGTMGEYGTPNIDIEEGWLDIEHKGRSDRFLFPRQAGSIYHTSKIMDTDLLWFAVRTWGLRVTDLMQGPVYGFLTPEMRRDDGLATAVYYDEIFGTVVNRFVVQAVAGHPLTVYGAGGQTRGFIDINDSLRCIELALLNPPTPGAMNIYNQVTETYSVVELANLVAAAARGHGLDVEIRHVNNPRRESESHYYNPRYQALRQLGLDPHLLDADSLGEMLEFATRHAANVSVGDFTRNVTWR